MDYKPSIAIFLTHPVQYYSPWFAELSHRARVKVFYALQATAKDQASAGFDAEFTWDIDLLSGYQHEFLENVSAKPGLDRFAGCDVPGVSNVLEHEAFDAVLMFGWNKKFYWQVALAARRRKIPVFIRVDSQLESPRGFLTRLLKSIPYRLFLPRLGNYIVPGRRTRRYLSSYGVAESRIHDVPHVIDVDRFRKCSAETDVWGVRHSFDTEPDQVVLLFVGKLIAKKRPELIVKAMSALDEEEKSRLTLWIAGTGELESLLVQAAKLAGIEMKLLGFVNQTELPNIYAAADYLVLPSDGGETWGLVINEAFACATPAIVSDAVGACPDLIIDGETGWKFADNNVSELEDILHRCTRENAAEMQPALSKMSDRFTYEMGSLALLDAIQKVTNEL